MRQRNKPESPWVIIGAVGICALWISVPSPKTEVKTICFEEGQAMESPYLLPIVPQDPGGTLCRIERERDSCHIHIAQHQTGLSVQTVDKNNFESRTYSGTPEEDERYGGSWQFLRNATCPSGSKCELLIEWGDTLCPTPKGLIIRHPSHEKATRFF